MTTHATGWQSLHLCDVSDAVTVWRALSHWRMRKDGVDVVCFPLPPKCTVDRMTEVKTWKEPRKGEIGIIKEDIFDKREVFCVDFEERRIYYDPNTWEFFTE